MPQYARPDSDISLGGWTSPSFNAIDETVADDGDYTTSADAPSNDTLEVGLSNVVDPLSSSNHILRYRYAKNTAGGAQINLTVSLRQGAGTEIAAWVHTDISDTITAAAQTLTAMQADAITDYPDLRTRYVANQV